MKDLDSMTTREMPDRRAMLAGVAGLIGASALGASPLLAAPAVGSVEASNLAIARSFCAAWAVSKIDLPAMVSTYFADDATVRVMDSTSIAHGRNAIQAMFGGWLEADRHFRLEIVSEAALGPLVIQLRNDVILIPGAPKPHVDRIASVFVMAAGKIKEWSDYVMA